MIRAHVELTELCLVARGRENQRAHGRVPRHARDPQHGSEGRPHRLQIRTLFTFHFTLTALFPFASFLFHCTLIHLFPEP